MANPLFSFHLFRRLAYLSTAALVLLSLNVLARAPSSGNAWALYGGGVNVLSNDPLWTQPAKSHFHGQLFGAIRAAGFRHVRINLHAFAHMDAANHVDPKWLATLDRVIDEASAAHLGVILDEHDYRLCGNNADMCRQKLVAFWSQAAPRYRNAPANLLFEILNEPNHNLDAGRWNALLAETLAVIRASNATRIVIVGPADFNSFKTLQKLQLPSNDRHLLVAIHYYQPFAFTHQGAPWTTPSRENKLNVPWGTPADRAAIEADFDAIATWATTHKRPVIIDEFGVYDKAPMSMRAAWAAAVARAAERRGFAWSWWQFTEGFTLYDTTAGRWVTPLKNALIPPKHSADHAGG